MLVLILLTDIDPHLLQEESKTCPRDSRISHLRCSDQFYILMIVSECSQPVEIILCNLVVILLTSLTAYIP
jgi:hypothetical protein